MSPWIKYYVASGLLVLAMALASCGKAQKAAEKTPEKATTDQATQTAPRTFKSPAEAGSALFDAAKAGDRDALLVIFGPEAKELLFSGDAVQDKNNRERFLSAYTQMNRWSTNKQGSQTLYLGADNSPFPIPLKKSSAGQWYFDTAAGKDEVLARRIGNNELVTINVLGDIAGAQELYFAQAHGGAKQYAQKLVSDPGQQNGLYWQVAEGQPPSPLGDLAQALGYSHSDKPQPFSGYQYRVITKQGATAKGAARDYMTQDGKLTGGFGVIAYPAEYGNSGIMTFMVGPDGIVYQKNLGEKTAEVAAGILEYNPDQAWDSLSTEPIQALTATRTARK
jgi:hypothetical protein